jgi:type IV secretion system protein VirB10
MGTGAIADNNFSGDSDYYRSSTQGSVMGAAGNISQVGQQIAGKAMNIQPTLIIPAGYEFNIIVNKDMILSPYHKLANPTAVRIVPLGHAK